MQAIGCTAHFDRMIIIGFFWKNLIKRTILLLSVISVVAQASLPNYQAEYDISVRGVRAGTLVHQAFFTENSYRIETVTAPSLAAKMLGFGQTKEVAEGDILLDALIVPKRYQRVMQGNVAQRLVYEFDYEKNEIATQIGNEAKTLQYDLAQYPLDMLSFITQQLLDAKEDNFSRNYALLSADVVRNYQFQRKELQRWIDLDGKNIEIEMYSQFDGDRESRIYLARNPIRLVQLVQLRGSQAHFALKLVRYSWQ